MQNGRELFSAIMNYKKPDRVPVYIIESITEQAKRKWCRDEGLSIEMDPEYLLGYDGKVFSLKMHNQPPLPAFVKRNLSIDEDYRVYSDNYGFIVKEDRKCTVGPRHYMYVGAPLTTRNDWADMKKRYDPMDIRRFPIDWGDELFEHLNNSDEPVTLTFNWGPGRGIKNGYMFGFDRFMEIVVEEPELLCDIFEFWADYTVRFLDSFIGKLRPDAFYFAEDGMGYKNSTLISPAMFKKIYMPHMRKVVDFLYSKGVNLIGYYSSGNLNPLIPCFLETGINILTPLECAAGMDALELKKEYGRDLRLIGNISREAIMSGKNEIREEVERKVSYLMEQGGYIPGMDDQVLPDMKFEDVKYFIDLVKSIKV